MKAIIPTHNQVRRALQIYEQIDRLQAELTALFGVKSPAKVATLLDRAEILSETPGKRRGIPQKTVPASGRRRKKTTNTASAPSSEIKSEITPGKRRGSLPGISAKATKAKRTISPEHREAIATAQKRRWAAARGEQTP